MTYPIEVNDQVQIFLEMCLIVQIVNYSFFFIEGVHIYIMASYGVLITTRFNLPVYP